MTAELNAQIFALNERITDLEIDLHRVCALFGRSIEDVSAVVGEIRALQAKTGDTSVNAMLAMALRIRPDLKEARDAIDRVLLREIARPDPVHTVHTTIGGDVILDHIRQASAIQLHTIRQPKSFWRKIIPFKGTPRD